MSSLKRNHQGMKPSSLNKNKKMGEAERSPEDFLPVCGSTFGSVSAQTRRDPAFDFHTNATVVAEMGTRILTLETLDIAFVTTLEQSALGLP